MVKHTIYMIRHGNSEGNRTKIILPTDKDVLTELGKTQAENLGAALSDVKFTKVYSSDYARTLETSEIVLSKSKYSQNVPIAKEARLREKNFGAYEGQPYREGLKELAALLAEGKTGFDWYPEKAETWEQMFDRSDNFFNELCSLLDKSENAETVMLTSHAFFIQSFMMYLKKSEALDKIEGKPDGFSSTKRPLEMIKIHEKGHLEAADSLNDFINSPNGKIFQNCVQT